MDSSRGDVLKFAQGDAEMPGTERLFARVDELVRCLKECPQVADRLMHTDFSNQAMFAVYPGESTRYIKHTDNSALTDGRRLTTLLYLNKEWQPEHGGCLRVFEPGMESVRVRRDIEPRWNRLVIFWSDEVPHEVLPSFRDRVAVSIWYVCAKESLQTEDAFLRLCTKVRTVSGLDRSQRLEAAAGDDQQRRVLRILGSDSAKVSLERQDRQDQELLDAVKHSFVGCDRFRRQRERLNTIFGWDARVLRLQQEMEESRLRFLHMFQSSGVPLPRGIQDAMRSELDSVPAKAVWQRVDEVEDMFFEAVD